MKATLYQKCIDEKRLSLLTEWAGEKNAPLTPWTVTPGSRKRVWWRCEKGHEWQAAVSTRWSGHGCPVCAGVVGKKRLARMQELEASARLSLARRVPMLPERYIPTPTTPPAAAR